MSDKLDVLFVGHFTAKSSWGQAANDYVKCLEHAKDINLQCSNFPIGDVEHNCEFKETYAYKYSKAGITNNDVLLQMCLPSFFYKDGRFKQNVGIFFTECDHSNIYHGVRRTQMLDKLFVASKDESLYWSQHHTNPYNIGLPIELTKYNKKYEDFSHLTKKNKQTYTFYNISEDTERKNLDDIVRAFYIAFSKRDNVRLILKVNQKSNIKDRIQNIKKESRAIVGDNWPDIGIIDQNLTEDEICSLHQSCDCYVSASRGEAWCYPAADAVVFRNMLISSIPLDYMCKVHQVVESTKDCCKVTSPPTSFHYTGYDKWWNVNVDKLSETMKKAYHEKPYASLSSTDVMLIENVFSYEAIGTNMYNILTDYKNV